MTALFGIFYKRPGSVGRGLGKGTHSKNWNLERSMTWKERREKDAIVLLRVWWLGLRRAVVTQVVVAKANFWGGIRCVKDESVK